MILLRANKWLPRDDLRGFNREKKIIFQILPSCKSDICLHGWTAAIPWQYIHLSLSDVPTIYQQHITTYTENIQTIYRPYSNTIATLYQHFTNNMPTAYQQYTNTIPAIYQHYTSNIPILSQQYINTKTILTIYQQCNSNIPKLYQQYTKTISTTYQ